MKELLFSTKAFEAAKKLIPGGVNSPVRSFRSVGGTPPFIDRAKGSKIYDIDGNEYIDYVLSYGPFILGHAEEKVTKAIQIAAEKSTSYGGPTLAETILAGLINKLVPSMEMIRMVNSGTEATMSALRLARAFTGRENIVKFNGCYHGHHDSLLVKAGSGAMTLGVPDSPGVPVGVAQNTITVNYNDVSALKKVFAERGETIAAVIIEPTPGNMGLILPSKNYLAEVRKITTQYKTLLIFDEVMSGFRAARGGAQELFNITPDLTCLGKVIGGGLPVACYGGRQDIMHHVSPLGSMYQAGTLSGNPLAMVAGICTLEKLLTEDICSSVETKTAILSGLMEEAAKKAGHNYQFHRIGSMFTCFFTENEVYDYDTAATADLNAFKKFFHSMLEQGIYLPPSQFETWFMSSAHSSEDIEFTAQCAEKAFKSL